jgi:hypothetical protein
VSCSKTITTTPILLPQQGNQPQYDPARVTAATAAAAALLVLVATEALPSPSCAAWALQVNSTERQAAIITAQARFLKKAEKIERIISLLSTSPEGEVRCRCQNGMAYKD